MGAQYSIVERNGAIRQRFEFYLFLLALEYYEHYLTLMDEKKGPHTNPDKLRGGLHGIKFNESI